VETRFVETPEAAGEIAVNLRTLKPSLVIIELSCSSPGPQGFGTASRSRESIKNIFAACRAAKVDVVALAIPPLPDAYKRINYASLLLEESAAAGVPAVDFGKFAAARGKGFEGEYYARPDQLDVQGHLLAGRILAAALVNP
jgi:hypothetical protein